MYGYINSLHNKKLDFKYILKEILKNKKKMLKNDSETFSRSPRIFSSKVEIVSYHYYFLVSKQIKKIFSAFGKLFQQFH